MRKTIDLVLLLAWIGMLVPLGIQAAGSAGARADGEIVEREARLLYRGFCDYYGRTGQFPNAYAAIRFEPDSLDPLRRRGYYDGPLTTRLLRERIDAYDSPDDRGLNQEFWVEMTLAADPAVRYVVARSDGAPLGGGRWLDGAYVLRDGRLERL